MVIWAVPLSQRLASAAGCIGRCGPDAKAPRYVEGPLSGSDERRQEVTASRGLAAYSNRSGSIVRRVQYASVRLCAFAAYSKRLSDAA